MRKGEYTEAVPFLKGKFVKDSDVDIVRYLAKEGLLYHKESMNIATRIAGAVIHHFFIMQESWLIRTTAIKDYIFTK